MKKKSLVLMTSVMLVALLIVGGTMAWFTAETGTASNDFKAGTLKIKLVDCFNFCGAQNVNPGDCYDKDVYVYNYGTKRAFVRIAKDMAFEGGLDLDVVEYTLGSGWVEDDNYFYYTQELGPKFRRGNRWYYPTTTKLFADNQNGKNICFNGPNMGNQYQGKKFTINVKAEAIQVTNGAALAEWKVNPATLTNTGMNKLNLAPEPEAVEGEELTAEEIVEQNKLEEKALEKDKKEY